MLFLSPTYVRLSDRRTATAASLVGRHSLRSRIDRLLSGLYSVIGDRHVCICCFDPRGETFCSVLRCCPTDIFCLPIPLLALPFAVAARLFFMTPPALRDLSSAAQPKKLSPLPRIKGLCGTFASVFFRSAPALFPSLFQQLLLLVFGLVRNFFVYFFVLQAGFLGVPSHRVLLFPSQCSLAVFFRPSPHLPSCPLP